MGVKGLNRGGLPGSVSWAEIMGNMYLLQKIIYRPGISICQSHISDLGKRGEG